ncbi:MAG: LuxR family transcriptional regulator [Actinobacteria bacterium]|nr:LuxR family transcriptional regulator [Actinomycetota bacterium]
MTTEIHAAASTTTPVPRMLTGALEALRSRAPRVLLIGGAGAGKSTALRALRDALESDGRSASLVHGRGPDPGDFPASEVLLVDDLHLLSDERIAGLHRRARDPAAALIAATRPLPDSASARAVADTLEQQLPAIVLGHVSRAEMLDAISARGLIVPDECVTGILDLTAGVSWLTWAALAQHDVRDCAGDERHDELVRSLQASIVRRLERLDSALRASIEEACLGSSRAGAPESPMTDWVQHGYAEGLLLRNGQPAPIVRRAVRAAVPLRRLIALSARSADIAATVVPDGGLAEVDDPQLAAVLLQHADRMRTADPAQAARLYDGAVACGADPAALAARRAEVLWLQGDVEGAGTVIERDGARAPEADAPALADLAAGVWAERGMLAQGDAVHRLRTDRGPLSPSAMLAAFGTGDAEALIGAEGRPGPPTALGVSMQLLQRGLIGSVTPGASEASLTDLVRSAELYTRSGHAGAICEPPAVVAANVALGLGALATAEAVLADAIAAGHSGAWARHRLLLWQAWVQVQRARPNEARESLRRAEAAASEFTPRSALLAHAVRVALVRRYEDTAALESAWREARGALLRVDIDAFLLHPLTELIGAAARLGDADHTAAAFDEALTITARWGSPPLWTAHLHWAGIQQGILLGRPDVLAPHAKVLVIQAAHSEVAATMAKAGRVWTSVLAGSVDPEAVEQAAIGLSSIGMMWDAARLAGHGAGRATDRRVAARLLACAREIHPADGTRSLVAADDSATGTERPPAAELLSERELEIARLVLQGRTYAQIGEAIFISPRTAEHHIAHIRRRLGATSRADVLAKLRELLGEEAALSKRGSDE